MQLTRTGEVLRLGALEVRVDDRLAVADGRALRLSMRELEVLTVLGRRTDRIVTREELYEEVWGQALCRGDRSVDVFVHKVRHKLSVALPQWQFIHTHVGIGYRLAPEWRGELGRSASVATTATAGTRGLRRSSHRAQRTNQEDIP